MYMYVCMYVCAPMYYKKNENLIEYIFLFKQ